MTIPTAAPAQPAKPRACSICGGVEWKCHDVLWKDLSEQWELSPEEIAYVNRQQGMLCTTCGANLRSAALAASILSFVGFGGTFQALADSPLRLHWRVLEINEAGVLSPYLRQWPGHEFGQYPEVDLQRLPFSDSRFDLVVHSDTLEHVPDPLKGLEECHRVLVPGGRCIFTVPLIVNRMSRNRGALTRSYHGNPGDTREDFLVHTEFGADTWSLSLRAGFAQHAIDCFEYPAALVQVATKGSAHVRP